MPRKYKVGQILFEVNYDEKGFWTTKWHIRTIRGGKVTAIEKNEFTWGKKSTKHGDWGWLDPIDSRYYRKSWKEDGKCPLSLTVLEAWKEVKDEVERWEDEGPDKVKLLRTVASNITKHTPKKKKKDVC